MTEYISYATDWDLYKGSKDWSQLSTDTQDKIIRGHFASSEDDIEDGTDTREFVMAAGWKKAQAQGLWHVLLTLMLANEDAGIASPSERNEKMRDAVFSGLSGTFLGLRIQEAWLSDTTKKTDYRATELEKLADPRAFDKAIGWPLWATILYVRSKLKLTPEGERVRINERIEEGLSHFGFTQLWDAGKIKLYVDKGLAFNLAAAGFPTRGLTGWMNIGFVLMIFASIPCAIFIGWYAFPLLVVGGIAIKRLVAKLIIEDMRKAAIESEEKFNILVKAKAIWFEPNDF